MKRQVATLKWARWIGFAGSVLVLALFLLYPKNWMRSDPNATDTYLFLGLLLAPALAAALLCFTRLFPITTVPGTWFLFLAVMHRLHPTPPAWSSLFVFGALAMLLAPVVALVSGRSDRSADNKLSDQSNESKR